MNILELSQQRFSARKYTTEPVSQADLDYILECVRLAPSAVNRQPWKFELYAARKQERSCGLHTTVNGFAQPHYISCA